MLDMYDKTGEIYYEFNAALWLLHLDRLNKTPLIPLELAVELMRHTFKDEIN